MVLGVVLAHRAVQRTKGKSRVAALATPTVPLQRTPKILKGVIVITSTFANYIRWCCTVFLHHSHPVAKLAADSAPIIGVRHFVTAAAYINIIKTNGTCRRCHLMPRGGVAVCTTNVCLLLLCYDERR